MTLQALSRSLDEVAAHLPFAVDDYRRANEAFMRWRQSGEEEDLKVVDLWVYCYTRRYFLAKFIRDLDRPDVSLDEPVGEAFQRVRNSLDRVEQPDRFANYVSVICKRAYFSFRARHAQVALVDLDRAPELASPSDADSAMEGENDVVKRVEAILEQLPEFLREVTRLRPIEEMSYEEMEEETGRSPSVLRSYVHKAILRLREDPALQRLLQDLEG
jgi:RNA polymerase sigma factor (sigma-70 family)